MTIVFIWMFFLTLPTLLVGYFWGETGIGVLCCLVIFGLTALNIAIAPAGPLTGEALLGVFLSFFAGGLVLLYIGFWWIVLWAVGYLPRQRALSVSGASPAVMEGGSPPHADGRRDGLPTTDSGPWNRGASVAKRAPPN